jgi:hypothetical protein
MNTLRTSRTFIVLTYSCLVYFNLRASGEWVKNDLIPPDNTTQNLIKRDGAAQYLQAWNKDDLDRLSIEGLKIEKEVVEKEKGLAQQTDMGILEGVKREI